MRLISESLETTAPRTHAAAVIAAAVDDGDRRRRAHINDDLRQGIIVDARHGVYDEVAAELGGVVDLNAQARLDAEADDERRNVQVFLNGGLHRAGHGRHDGRDDRAVDVCGVDAVHLKRGAQDRGVFCTVDVWTVETRSRKRTVSPRQQPSTILVFPMSMARTIALIFLIFIICGFGHEPRPAQHRADRAGDERRGYISKRR